MLDIEDDLTQLEVDTAFWYSQLYKMVDSKTFPVKTTPQNAINILEGMAKKGQVKQVELDWVGIIDWLKTIQGKVTKSDVLRWLDKNNVSLEETVLGTSLFQSEAGRGIMADSLLDLYAQSHAYSNEGWGWLADELADWVNSEGTMETLKDIPMIKEDIFGGNEDDMTLWLEDVSVEEVETEYGQYTMDEEGSPAYREILINMRYKDYVDEAIEALDWYANKIGHDWEIKDTDSPNTIRAVKLEALRKLPLYKLQKEGAPAHLITQLKKWQHDLQYKIPHWKGRGIGDVVAHLRFDEKQIDGKRTMFVEEIQSDWAQKGRKVGYVDYTKAAPVGYHIVKTIKPGDSFVTQQLYEDSTGKLLGKAP